MQETRRKSRERNTEERDVDLVDVWRNFEKSS